MNPSTFRGWLSRAKQALSPRMIVGALLWILLFACCFGSFSIADSMERLYGTVSLRYDSPLTGAQVRATLATAQSRREAPPTFWAVTPGMAAVGEKPASVFQISFLGEPGQAYFAEFSAGAYPGAGDLYGCSVSDTLAFQLWGSLDVVGQKLSLNDQIHSVRGVFQDKRSLVLTAAGPDAGFTAIELTADVNGDAALAARNFATSHGLDEPGRVLGGPVIAALSAVVGWIPIFLASALVIVSLWRRRKSIPPTLRKVLLFSLLLGFVLLLPSFLSSIPNWLLPSKWSDFSFWHDLLQTLCDRAESWFSLAPTVKDVAAKTLLAGQNVILLLEIALPFLLIWNLKRQGKTRRDQGLPPRKTGSGKSDLLL